MSSTKKRLKADIDHRLTEGQPKAGIFQALSGQGLSDRRLAWLLASRPHPVLLQRHARLVNAMVCISWLQFVLVLILCLWATRSLGLLAGLVASAVGCGIVYVFIWGFRHHRAWVYTLSIVLGLLNLPEAIGSAWAKPVSGGLGLLMSLALLALTWHVRARLFPDLGVAGARKQNGAYRFTDPSPADTWRDTLVDPAPALPSVAPVAPVVAVHDMQGAGSTRSSLARLRLAFLLGLLVIVSFGAWVRFTFPTEVREFHLHFTTHRPQANFHLGFLSDEWDEDDLRQKLGWLTFRCYANAPGRYLDDRSCFADIRAFNQVSAMSLSFFFADGRLNRAAVQLPSWYHDDGLRMLARMHGQPIAAQATFSSGVRLIGWQLDDGAAVYYNRDRPFNPLERNGILWVSARHCRTSPCFALPEPPAGARGSP
jgi:hypothetical protein